MIKFAFVAPVSENHPTLKAFGALLYGHHIHGRFTQLLSAADGSAVISYCLRIMCTLQPGFGPYSDGSTWTCVNQITVPEHIVTVTSGSSASVRCSLVQCMTTLVWSLLVTRCRV